MSQYHRGQVEMDSVLVNTAQSFVIFENRQGVTRGGDKAQPLLINRPPVAPFSSLPEGAL